MTARRWGLGAVVIAIAISGCGSVGGSGPRAARLSNGQVAARYAALPLSFVANDGQAPAGVRYVASGSGYTLSVGDGGVALGLARSKTAGDVVRVLTPGGTLRDPVASRKLAGKVSYFIGDQRSKWVHGAATFGRVSYQNVWPGVSLAFHGHQGTLEYDFDLAPGASPGVIALRFAGARSVRSDGHGGAIVTLKGGRLRMPAPHATQGRRTVSSRLVVSGDTVRVALGSYDRSRPLVIDPTLVYSTYLGGSDLDLGLGIAVDAAGDAYITGFTSGDFPTTGEAYQPSFGGDTDAFVTKLNSAGSALVYSTYLGGTGYDQGNGIAVDAAGNAYVTGSTDGDFPTVDAAQDNYGGDEDAFVAELNPDGTALDYSTYLGGTGNDQGTGIAVDAAGDAYITGYTQSANFRTTTGVTQPSYGGGGDAFVAELSPAGALDYSTYLGGSDEDEGDGIAVDRDGNTYITGYTGGDFPTTGGAYQTIYGGGGGDAFVAKLNPAGTALDYSTYLGGSDEDGGNGIAVDADGNAYVTGYTDGGFPTTGGAYQTIYGGGDTDAFVAELSPAGALDYSTYLGGSDEDEGDGIAVDASGEAYVTGWTEGDFPTTTGAYQTSYGGDTDAFVTKLNSAGSAVVYSTYLGGTGNDLGLGIAVDAAGDAYITGETGGGFPTTGDAYQTIYGGGEDAFVAELALAPLSCAGPEQTIPHNTSVALDLGCSPIVNITGYTILSGPADGTLGTVDQSTGEVTYTPNAGFSGADSFTFEATAYDGTVAVGTAHLSVAAAPAPTCADTALSLTENTTATLVLSCSAGGDPLTLNAVTGPSNGTLGTLDGDTITYTPDAGYTGADTVTFDATDTDDSQTSATATIYLTVVPQQQGPQGPAGTNGTNGTPGAVELVTCRTRTVKHKTRTTCTGKAKSGTVALAVTAGVKAKLARAGKTYATGYAHITKTGDKVLLLPKHKLPNGKYTLTIKRGKKLLTKAKLEIS